MTPQQLKNSILQLAIQGKLVEQRPEEGTAEDLYREIQKENIATDKSEPTIAEDDIPFDVPESWKMVYIRNVAILYNGRAYKQSELLESGKYPVLRVGNLFTRNKWYYSNLELEPQKYCDKGDLLYSWSASFGPYIWNGEKVIYHYHIWKIEFSRYVDKKFFYYFLLADTDNIKRSGHGLAMIHVTKSGTEKRFFPLPPLAEQKRIVARIEELLPLVDRYEQAWTQLQALDQRFPVDLQKSILQLAIQGRLVEQRPEEGSAEDLYREIQAEKARLVKAGKIKKDKPLPEIADDELPFDIPANWKWVRLGTLLRVIGGISYDKKDVAKEGFRILRGGNIQNMNVLTAEDDVFLPQQYKDEDKIIRVGDFLIVASTGSKVVIGKAAYVDKLFPDTMIGAFLRICRPFSLSLAGYLRIIFASDFYRKHIRELAQGTNINNVKEAYITQFAIPLPPLAEQKRIVARIEELLPLCDVLKGKIF